MAGNQLPTKTGYVYKTTTNSDLVVHRMVHLFPEGKFHSFHSFERDPNDRKSWYLDKHCQLSPENASDIHQARRKHERQQGTWTITATMVGAGRELDLYLFTVVWPKSWFNKGYSTFTMGSESLDEARAWHAAIQASISMLKAKKAKKGDSTPSFVPSSPRPSIENSVSSCRYQLESLARSQDSARFSELNMAESPQFFDPLNEDSEALKAAAAAGEDSSEDDMPLSKSSFKRSSTLRPSSSLSERWVPYKQTNGVAVYYLDEPSTSLNGMGGEYLVSASVRGCPSAVLDVLVNGSSNTTILGPASKVELLDGGDGPGKSIMRLVLEAPGWAGRFCAPREMLVERMLKTEEGMHVVLFSSVEEEAVSTTSSSCESSSTRKGRGNHRRSLYRRPVVGWVRGTYAIAPLENETLQSSNEALITCIIKVDLKGACGDKSWARPFADALGWTDAFLDRILMTVILIRDEVEHSRFSLKPLSLLNSTVLDEAAGLQGGSRAASATPGGQVDSAPSGHLTASPRSVGRMYSQLNRGSSLKPDARILSNEASKDTEAMAKKLLDQASSGQIHIKPPTAPHPAAAATVASCSSGGSVVPEEGSKPAGEQQQIDLEHIKTLCTLDQKYWSEIHAPGKPAPFVVRGPTYLKDRKKIPAGFTAFTFGAMDVVTMPHPVEHVARYLRSIRQSRVPFAFIINLIIPGVPLLGIVATFITDKHPDILGTPPKDPMEEGHDWQPFDFVLHKFINGDDATRNLMLKLIPHIADGSWVVKQSVGTTPVITGKALKTTYHMTKQYIEIDIDVSANNVAAYVTGLVRGATKSLVIDMGFVLEGTTPWELPEVLLGTLRLNYLDIKLAKPLDLGEEIPLLPAIQVPAQTKVVRSMHSRNPSLTSPFKPC